MIDLDAIKARYEAASPGPWSDAGWLYNLGMDSGHLIDIPDTLVGVAVTRKEEDAEFIAHAREDVPALVAEVEQLRRRVATSEHALRED